MTIKKGKVYKEEDEIGELTGNLLRTLDTSGGVQYAFNLKLIPGATVTPPFDAPSATIPPTLETYYGVKSMMGAIVIEGNLKPFKPRD